MCMLHTQTLRNGLVLNSLKTTLSGDKTDGCPSTVMSWRLNCMVCYTHRLCLTSDVTVHHSTGHKFHLIEGLFQGQ